MSHLCADLVLSPLLRLILSQQSASKKFQAPLSGVIGSSKRLMDGPPFSREPHFSITARDAIRSSLRTTETLHWQYPFFGGGRQEWRP